MKPRTILLCLAATLLLQGCPRNGAVSLQDAHTKAGGPDIFEAAETGNIDAVKALLQKDPALANARWSNGVTPLWMASYEGHMQIVELLLDHGATIDSSAGILEIAAFHGHGDIVETLLAGGGDVNEKNDYGLTPLHGAASSGHKDIVEILLHSGADINIKDNDGYTPLRAAAKEGYVDIIKLLLSAGAETAIFDEALMGRTDRIVELLDKDPSLVHATDPVGWTPLHFAAEVGNMEVCEFLLDRGANIDAATSMLYYTPLLLSVSSGHMDAAALLLKKGADVNTSGFEGMNALLEAGNNTAMVKFLIKNGADVEARYCYMDYTILHEAVRHGYDEVVSILIEHGSNPNIKADEGWSPLHVAENETVADILISSGADVNARSDYGQTPLHHAASGYCSECNPVKICKTLLAYGADVNVRDENGDTPLKLALDHGLLKVAEFLKQYGGTV